MRGRRHDAQRIPRRRRRDEVSASRGPHALSRPVPGSYFVRDSFSATSASSWVGCSLHGDARPTSLCSSLRKRFCCESGLSSSFTAGGRVSPPAVVSACVTIARPDSARLDAGGRCRPRRRRVGTPALQVLRVGMNYRLRAKSKDRRYKISAKSTSPSPPPSPGYWGREIVLRRFGRQPRDKRCSTFTPALFPVTGRGSSR